MLKRYEDVPNREKEKIDKVERLIAHGYSDYEIFTEMADDHPARVRTWILIARQRNELSLI